MISYQLFKQRQELKELEFISNIDITVMTFIQEQITNPVLDFIMPTISFMGNLGLVWVFIIILLLCRRQTRHLGIAVLAAILLGQLIGELLLKNIVGRARPFMDFPEIQLIIEAPKTFSFPSGHSASSFAAAVVLSRLGKAEGIAAFIIAALIAFSRLYLSVHYFTDILAGIMLGLLCAFAVLKFCDKKEIPLILK